MRYSITSLAATVLKSFGVSGELHMSQAMPIADEIIKDGRTLEKCLIFSVDAVPEYIVEERAELFEQVRAHAPNEVSVRTVMPSITPVCYGAMMSGTYPDRNGLPEYKEPRIRDGVAQPSLGVTPFTQTLVRAGKRVAVVTCENGCIASMLYGRDADLYIIPNDDEEEIYRVATELVRNSDYELIFVYQFDYDHTMHACSPRGGRAIDVLRHTNEKFDAISDLAERCWSDKKHLLIYNCDHGAHAIGENGQNGAHGDDIPEDMNIKWFFGWN